MPFIAEVASRHARPKDCQALLYAPLERKLTYVKTQRYAFEFSGDETALTDFIKRVLVDEVCQDLHLNEGPLHPDAAFHLDYGMKPGVLDLEKETILRYHHELTDSAFAIESLVITRRLYVFGADDPRSAEPFVRDIVNPAIHAWHVGDVA